MGATNVWTKTLTNGTLTINAGGNAVKVSVVCRQGTVTVNGSGVFQGEASEPVNLNEGFGYNVTASVETKPIDGVTIVAATVGDIAEISIQR